MRDIDTALKSRILEARQTPANNANPAMEVIVTRPRTPIFDKRFWQETVVTANDTATCTSVAVRKTGRNPDKIYTAYISGGNLTVKAAKVASPISNMAWLTEVSVANCISCAVEFDGEFARKKQNIEYITEPMPWLFYVTGAGALYGGIIGQSPEILAASGVSSIDAVRGVRSAYGDVDQGLVVFYCYGGYIYYRQLINGVWTGQQQVTAAPTNVVSIKVERLFDYRICIQATDASGALWEIFSKMEASGWNGNEFISASLRQDIAMLPITFYNCDCHRERITVDISQMVARLYALSPVMVAAVNVDDGSGNYGRFVEIEWDENIFGESENVGQFTITDSGSGAWSCLGVERNGKVLTLEFMDFNNAINPVSVTYTPGTMTGDVVAVNADSLSFTAANLVPSANEPPVPISTSIPDDKTIIITFDKPVSSANWTSLKDGFAVTADEYDMIPEGTSTEQTYTIATIDYLPAEATNESVALNTATLTDTALLYGAISLAEEV